MQGSGEGFPKKWQLTWALPNVTRRRKWARLSAEGTTSAHPPPPFSISHFRRLLGWGEQCVRPGSAELGMSGACLGQSLAGQCWCGQSAVWACSGILVEPRRALRGQAAWWGVPTLSSSRPWGSTEASQGRRGLRTRETQQHLCCLCALLSGSFAKFRSYPFSIFGSFRLFLT